MSEFVHLHVHSEYSLLDGLAHVGDLAAQARSLDMPALALTDHGAMYAALAFYRACQKEGLKPILGCEAYVVDDYEARGPNGRPPRPFHLVLLAENETGYRNLIHLVSAAHLHGFYYKPRMEKGLLAEHSDGLIALSACASGEVPRRLLAGDVEGAQQAATWHKEVFGPERYYLELQDHETEDLRSIRPGLIELSQELEIPLVATNDVHYIRPQDASAHDLLLCIQTNASMNDPNRMRLAGTGYHMRSAEEMAEVFSDVPEALSNTLAIAERCQLDLEFTSLHLPPFPVPEGHTPATYLRSVCEEGLRQRYPHVTEEIQKRLDHELNLIERMGFPEYFLIVWDLVRFGKSRGILVGPGRGSAAGSIVSYSLGITNLDPLAHRLIFERFLNPGRISMPDIDLDFPEDRRAEVIDYVVGRYGQDHVAQIITFGTMAARAAIRDAGRALDLPPGEVDRAAKLIPFGATIDQALEGSKELRGLYEDPEKTYIRDLIEAAKKLEGVARHASTHAAGMVISDEPLTAYVPLQRAHRGDAPLTQYDMHDLQRLGLLKIDILGLSTLTILVRTLEMVQEARGLELSLEDLDLNDPDVGHLLSSGDVVGIFQVESAGMRRVLKDLKPSSLEDVMAAIALYRPGPMKYIDEFISRKHGRTEITYPLPQLEPLLKGTYGIIVYQDQVIRLAMELAGFAPSEADLLRDAIGKKKARKLRRMRLKFIDGCVANGIGESAAHELFDMLEYFGRYGFNQAHAAAYAVITCQTAYLKAKFPVEYMAAFLSVEKGDSDRVAAGVAECRRLGIEIRPPDINQSGWDFTVEDGAIRFGLGAVKNVGEGPIQAIAEARREGSFENLDSFVRQTDLRQVNRRALECLIRAGALDRFGRRAQLLGGVGAMLAASAQHHRASEAGQMSLFTGGPAVEATGLLSLAPVSEVSRKEQLAWEKELMGVYVSEHPLQRVESELEKAVTLLCGQIDRTLEGETITTAGVVTSVRRITTRKGDPMAFARMEDLQGAVEVVVFPRVYERSAGLWQSDNILIITGRVEVDDDGLIKIICNTAADYRDRRPKANEGPAENRLRHLHITFQASPDEAQDIAQLGEIHQLLTLHPGEDRFSLYIERKGDVVQLSFPNDTTSFSPELAEALDELVPNGRIRVEEVPAA